jgi:hypothetical protein
VPALALASRQIDSIEKATSLWEISRGFPYNFRERTRSEPL